MAFWSLAAFRVVLATETDADSPGSEELLSQLRENYEALTMLAFDTGETGTVTTIAETVLTDSGQAWAVDEHNGRTLLITSGTAIGNTYTIDDTAATTLTCTGDTMATDGVAINDTFKVMYDLKVNTDGHDHDGVNSKYVSGERYFWSFDDTLTASSAGSWTQVAAIIWYKPQGINSIDWGCELRTNTASSTARARINIQSGDIGASVATSSASFDAVTGTMALSSTAVGWHELRIQLKNDNAAKDVVVRQVCMYGS